MTFLLFFFFVLMHTETNRVHISDFLDDISEIKVDGYTIYFCYFYKRKQFLCHPLCFSQLSPTEIGSTLKWKNLLLVEEQFFLLRVASH